MVCLRESDSVLDLRHDLLSLSYRFLQRNPFLLGLGGVRHVARFHSSLDFLDLTGEDRAHTAKDSDVAFDLHCPIVKIVFTLKIRDNRFVA